MYKSFNARALGIRGTLSEQIEMALTYGYDALDLNLRELEILSGARDPVEYGRSVLGSTRLRGGCWDFSVIGWREDEERFRSDLEQLPGYAKMAAGLGFQRTTTAVMPASNERPLHENFEWHRKRLQAIAEVLGAHGGRLGLEFLGPATLRKGRSFEFVHELEGILHLCDAVGAANVGVCLDAWHWYTSGGTLEQIGRLDPERIVAVHISDAPANVPLEEQVDNVRCLPGETGVIDIVGFLRTLNEIGYDGPVVVEPFSKRLRQMSREAAARTATEALKKVWEAAGLAPSRSEERLGESRDG